MLEALAHCRDTGARVRPVGWAKADDGEPTGYVAWEANYTPGLGAFVFRYRSGRIWVRSVLWPSEVFGEWEIVPESVEQK